MTGVIIRGRNLGTDGQSEDQVKPQEKAKCELRREASEETNPATPCSQASASTREITVV
jgi:hypothetical protein